MEVGLLFPSRSLDTRREAVETWIELANAAGFAHVVLGDHVLGVDDRSPQLGDWSADWPIPRTLMTPHTVEEVFREPFVLGAFIAARSSLHVMTGVLVLPQRQTALVAKQAAELDLLSNGGLRLGVGAGWNFVEFESMERSYEHRGRRLDEQMDVLRRLWTERVVDFDGEFHRIAASGIQALPVQRPIPIWIGGSSASALRRVASLGDGWCPDVATRPDGEFDERLAAICSMAHEHGRDPESLGVEVKIDISRLSDAEAGEVIDAWRRRHVTHLCVDTGSDVRRSLADHAASIERAARLTGLVAD